MNAAAAAVAVATLWAGAGGGGPATTTDAAAANAAAKTDKAMPLGIGGCVVVNLDKHPARLRAFHARAAAAGLRVDRVRAVDSSDGAADACVAPAALARLRAAQAAGARQRHSDLTPGAVGCYLSHLDVYRRWLERGEDRPLLVFEDDADVPPDLLATLRRVADLPDGWDMFMLGCIHDAPDPEPGPGDADDGGGPAPFAVVRVRRFYLTHAYVVTPRAMRVVLRRAFPLTQQFDSLLADLSEAGELAVYAAHPNVVSQDNYTMVTSVQTLGTVADAEYF